LWVGAHNPSWCLSSSNGSDVCVVNAAYGWLSISGVLTLAGSFAVSSTTPCTPRREVLPFWLSFPLLSTQFGLTCVVQGVIQLSSGGIWNQNDAIIIRAISCTFNPPHTYTQQPAPSGETHHAYHITHTHAHSCTHARTHARTHTH